MYLAAPDNWFVSKMNSSFHCSNMASANQKISRLARHWLITAAPLSHPNKNLRWDSPRTFGEFSMTRRRQTISVNISLALPKVAAYLWSIIRSHISGYRQKARIQNGTIGLPHALFWGEESTAAWWKVTPALWKYQNTILPCSKSQLIAARWPFALNAFTTIVLAKARKPCGLAILPLILLLCVTVRPSTKWKLAV